MPFKSIETAQSILSSVFVVPRRQLGFRSKDEYEKFQESGFYSMLCTSRRVQNVFLFVSSATRLY